jgi:hypothetical protein
MRDALASSIENPRVRGSIPRLGTIFRQVRSSELATGSRYESTTR